MEIQPINFPSFKNIEIFSFPAIADGSCLIHACLQAYYIPYREQTKEEKMNLVREVRDNMTSILPSVYPKLAKGELKYIPELSMENMRKTLLSSDSLGEGYIELLSLALDKDIYFLSYQHKDIYPLVDNGVLYKGRPSIVLIYGNNHYDTVVLRENGKFLTHFSSNNPFIVFLRKKGKIILK